MDTCQRSKMGSILFTAKLFLLLLPLLKFSTGETWIKSGYWYSGSEYPVPDINSALYTHLIAAFAHMSTNYELYISPSDEPYISTFTEIVKQKNPSVVTFLSIWCGETRSFDEGEANSSLFFQMTSQQPRRKSFIESSIRKARSYGFQGIDLFGMTPSTPENMTNMETFLDEWRGAIDLESNTSRLILTIAAYYSPVKNSVSYPVDSVRRNLDWVHLMSYDYHLSMKDKFTGGPAALYDPLSNLNTDYGVKEWINKGLPANKLVFGLAYHGYAWTLQDPKNKAIGAPTTGLAITRDGSMSYKYIKNYMRSYGAKSVFNSTYVVNYCTIGSFWIGFDDVEAIKTKVAYAKEKELLGYSIWQVPNDDTNDVLSRTAQAEAEDQQKKHRLLLVLLPTIIAIPLLLGVSACCNVLINTFQLYGSGLQAKDLYRQICEYFAMLKLKQPPGISPMKTSLVREDLDLLRTFCEIICNIQPPLQQINTFLYDPIKRLSLDWEKRVDIIEGITQGLLYLQEYSPYTVIHRDLKASNILLDSEMKPKISDFGIAKVFRKDEHEANTNQIVGTYGYVPPEYVKRGIYSRKYDVYSYGVLLLQIISGKRNSCPYGEHKNLNLLEFAYQMWKSGNASEFLDPSLDDAQSSWKPIRCMQVALLCVQEKWEDRPSMLEVFSMLKNQKETLPIPKMPR